VLFFSSLNCALALADVWVERKEEKNLDLSFFA